MDQESPASQASLRHLLIRPRRQGGESEIGFLLRAAELNGLGEGTRLFSALGVRCYSRQRICAICCSGPLAYWPVEWEDWSRPWCSPHKVWLVDRCVKCGDRFSASRMSFLACQCGAKLSDQVAAPVDVVVLEALGADEENFEVAVWLGAIVLHGVDGKPGKLQARRSVDDVRKNIEAGSEVLAGWPNAFLHALTGMRRLPEAGAAVAQLISDAFPGLHRALKRAPITWRQAIADAVDLCVRGECEAGRPLIGKNWFVATRIATANEHAKQLGVSYRRLRRVLGGGDPMGFRRITSGGRLRSVLSAEDVAIVSARLHDPMAMKTAARELGIKVTRLAELARSGSLARAEDGRLSRGDIQRFLALQLSNLSEIGADETEFASVAEAFKRWVPVARTSDFFSALSAGAIERRCVSGRDFDLKTLRVRRHDVQSWVRRADERK